MHSNPSPSILQDENSIANNLRRKRKSTTKYWLDHRRQLTSNFSLQVSQDPRDTSKASRFGHLYNKLSSQVSGIIKRDTTKD